MKVNIDRKMLPMKAHYFLYNAGTAPVVPFMPTFGRQMGFSSVVVGTIYTILPIVGLLAKPIFGWLADKFSKHKPMFTAFQILTAIGFFCIIFIPSIPKTTSMELHCNRGSTDLRYIPKNSELDSCITASLESRYKNNSIPCELSCRAEPWMWPIMCEHWNGLFTNCDELTGKTQFEIKINLRPDHIESEKNILFFMLKDTKMFCPHSNVTEKYFKTDCDIRCNEQYIMDLLTESKIQNHDVVGLYQFWMFFLFLAISWAAMAVVVSVGDAICFEMLGERHHRYGYQRLWGSVGWGVSSLIAGYLVDLLSGDSYYKNYTVVFCMTMVLIGLDILATWKLEHTQTKFSSSIMRDVGKMFLSLRIVVFFSWCIAVGLCTALVWNFLFWHLEDLGDLSSDCNGNNWMKTLQGLAMGIQCFGGELPFFFLSGWILKKIGHVNAMSLVLLGFGIRFMLYSQLTNPWWVLPIELFSGITFGLFYATMASYASIVAPPGTEATLQGLVGAIFEGVGVSAGSFIGGVLFRDIGGSTTFWIYGIAALCAGLIHAAIYIVMEWFNKNKGFGPNYLPPNDAIHMLDDQEFNVRT